MEPNEIQTKEQWASYEERKWLEAFVAGLRLDNIEWQFRNKLKCLLDRKRNE